MKTWANRPKDEAYLLNPAFCCTALATAIYSYTKVKKDGLPYPFAFMFLPIVLHKPTRDKLPLSVSTSMAAWLQDNSEVRILFYERLVSLKPHTTEAIQVGMLADRIIPKDAGLLGTSLNNSNINQSLQKLSGEAREIVLRARFLGKWFATAGDTHTIMAFWGVRP